MQIPASNKREKSRMEDSLVINDYSSKNPRAGGHCIHNKLCIMLPG